MSTCLTGWTASVYQPPEQGMSLILQGLNAPLASKRDVVRPYWLSLLADVQLRLGQTTTALHTLEDTLALVEATGTTCWQAELLRLKGELLMIQEKPTCQLGEAEAWFQQALDVARHQHARSWELRAVTSLARLWQQQGKRQNAYELLAPFYYGFTEGLDTADLQAAKALLAEPV